MFRFSSLEGRRGRATGAWPVIVLALAALTTVGLAATAASAQVQSTILTANFAESTEGFAYTDRNDPTATSYVSGRLAPGRTANGLTVTLGGVDDVDINNMSGAWRRSFVLDERAIATVRFDYRIEMDGGYEADEFTEARLAVNGTQITPTTGRFPRLTGASNGGADDSLGWATYTAQINLAAGRHNLDLIGFSNKKTFNNETAIVRFDNVAVTIPSTPSPASWIRNGGSEYRLIGPDLDWNQANTQAQALGGHLVAINGAAEQQWLVSTFTIDKPHWIGLNDAAIDGRYVWTNGDPVTYTNWMPEEPSGPLSPTQDYGVLANAQGQWDDQEAFDNGFFTDQWDDGYPRVAIVERPVSGPTPTATPVPPTATPVPPTPVPGLIQPGPLGVQTPLNGPHTLPGRIEAEDFDFGGQGYAYFDGTVANIGTKYRNSFVDVYTNSGGAGYVIGNTRQGEWVEYTVESPTAQALEVTARVSTGATAPGSLRLSINGVTAATIPIDRTGGWWTFSDESFGIQNFPAGSSVVRITWLSNLGRLPKINFDRLDIGDSGPTGPTCAGLSQEAEDAYLPGSLAEVTDGAASGGAYVQAAPLSAGRPGPSADFAEFCFTVPVAGNYRLDASVLAPNSADDSFYVTVDNGPVALWDLVRSTTWTADSVSDRGGANPVIYALNAGNHIVRVYQREDGTAFDTLALRLDSAATPTPIPATPTPVPPTPTATATPGPAPDGITFFDGLNQTGASQDFAPGVYAGANGFSSIGNNRASSINVTPGYIALVCTNGAATGTCRGFTSSKNNLGTYSLNNNISYVQVRQIGQPFILVPGNDLTQIVNRLPAGSDFVFRPGVYRGQSIVVKNDMTFTGQPGAILDGTGIDSPAITGWGDRVEIRGLEIRNYNPGLFNGAIQARNTANFSQNGRDWIVVNNDIHNNAHVGINVGPGMTVRGNKIHHNVQVGISGLGDDGNTLPDVTIDNNEVYENGHAYTGRIDFHEGGLKIIQGRRLKVINNNFHDNGGIDIYCDIRCNDVLVDNNDITNSTGRIHPGGIVYEISTNATISNNRITASATQPSNPSEWDVKLIMIMESHDIVIENNTITGGNASGLKEWAIGMRGAGTSGNRRAPTNVVVRGNTLRADRGIFRVGSADDLTASVVFSNNTYVQNGGSMSFRINGGTRTWSQWRATGRDVSGSTFS